MEEKELCLAESMDFSREIKEKLDFTILREIIGFSYS